ncbi:MAG: hypothetical protein Q8M94_07475 [Ignavibacteria bacterium]|nr:hypothetical protein [Ignavibacteria bacterium]
MDLKKRAFGLALGTMLGLFFLIGIWWFIIFDSQGGLFSELPAFFWGYVYGFFFGVFLAWLYNLFGRIIYRFI